jgi:hypothetical protein
VERSYSAKTYSDDHHIIKNQKSALLDHLLVTIRGNRRSDNVMIKVGPRESHYSAFRGNAEVARMLICQLVEELAAMVAASAPPQARR